MTKLLVVTSWLASLCFLSVAAGCGTNGSSSTIDDGTLAGMVYGQPWTFQAGGTDAFLSANDDNFFATFYAGTFTCGGSEPAGASLIVAVPKVPGDYPMSLMRNMTFVMGSDNKIATDGRVVVDSVTATTVTGALVGTFDDQNTVSGHFTLTVCPATN